MIGELALALALLELVALAAVVVASVLVWRKVAPTVAPLLAMFGPPAPALLEMFNGPERPGSSSSSVDA